MVCNRSGKLLMVVFKVAGSRPIALAITLVASFACGVDERSLKATEWEAVDSNNDVQTPGFGGCAASVAASCSNDVGSSAGSAGISEPTPANGVAGQALINHTNCGDLDRNGAPDSKQSLVGNATFTAETDYWAPEVGVSIVWEPRDVCGQLSSGSVGITYTNPYTGTIASAPSAAASQCVKATAGRGYQLRAAVFPRSLGTEAALGLVAYSSADCSGTKLAEVNSPRLGDSSGWRMATLDLAAPAGTVSLLVRLVAARSDWETSSAPANLYVDNVLLTYAE